MCADHSAFRDFSEAFAWAEERLHGRGYVLAAFPFHYLTGRFKDKKITMCRDTPALCAAKELFFFNEQMGLRVVRREDPPGYLCSWRSDKDVTLIQLQLKASEEAKADSPSPDGALVMDETLLIQGEKLCGAPEGFTRIGWQGNEAVLPLYVSEKTVNAGFWLKIRRYFSFGEAGMLHVDDWRPVAFVSTGSLPVKRRRG